MFKVNKRNTRASCEICSKLTIKTPERRSGVFIVNSEHISHLVLVLLLLTLDWVKFFTDYCLISENQSGFKPGNIFANQLQLITQKIG